MDMFKKISFRLVLLMSIITLSNYVYKYTFYQQDVKSNGISLNTHTHTTNTDGETGTPN